ncbi:MAG: OadG family transporter subunit [Ruminococcus sp.]|nr:OadG family transporter subunit [Ruminococcus sp.]
MNVSNVNNLLIAANQDLSLVEKVTVAAKVILTGFVVVFAVLVLLIFIIKGYSFAVNMVVNKPDKIKISDNSSVGSVVGVNNSIPEEIIAVIASAVSVMYSTDEKVRIKNVKKTDNQRSAWAKAGLFDNTRPF